MLIEYVTHASLFFKCRGVTLLTDPFYFFDDLAESFLCHFPARELKPEQFGRIDYVFCSHIHDDHCHRETMTALQDRIGTVVLPAGKPDFESRLRSYGFEKFLFLENEVSMTLPEGMVLTNYHDRNGVDTALVVEAEGKTVLHQNDCRLDREAFSRMAKRFTIDYAFVPHTGNQELYPLLLPRPEAIWRDLSRKREEAGLAEFIESLRILKPRVVVPYSFTVAYHNPDQMHLNGYNRTTPVEFKERVARDLPGQPCLILQPGDALDAATGAVARAPAAPENSWGGNLTEYVANLERHCREKYAGSRFDSGHCGEVHRDFAAYCRARFDLPFPDFLKNELVAFHVRGADGVRSYFLDVPGKKLFFDDDGRTPFLEITIPASLVRAFLSRRYDSFMILYSYRIAFQLNAPWFGSDEEECTLYVTAIMALLDYELYVRERL